MKKSVAVLHPTLKQEKTETGIFSGVTEKLAVHGSFGHRERRCA
jgi:hypothetical protein